MLSRQASRGNGIRSERNLRLWLFLVAPLIGGALGGYLPDSIRRTSRDGEMNALPGAEKVSECGLRSPATQIKHFHEH